MVSAAVAQSSRSVIAAKLARTFLESTSPENSSGLSCGRWEDLQERFLLSLARRTHLSLSNVHAVKISRKTHVACNVTLFNQRCYNSKGFSRSRSSLPIGWTQRSVRLPLLKFTGVHKYVNFTVSKQKTRTKFNLTIWMLCKSFQKQPTLSRFLRSWK